jgi:hypothetical protein
MGHEQMAAALRLLATNLSQPCPCCEAVAGEQHHEECSFEQDCPKEYLDLCHQWALAAVALQALAAAKD